MGAHQNLDATIPTHFFGCHKKNKGGAAILSFGLPKRDHEEDMGKTYAGRIARGGACKFQNSAR